MTWDCVRLCSHWLLNRCNPEVFGPVHDLDVPPFRVPDLPDGGWEARVVCFEPRTTNFSLQAVCQRGQYEELDAAMTAFYDDEFNYEQTRPVEVREFSIYAAYWFGVDGETHTRGWYRFYTMRVLSTNHISGVFIDYGNLM